MHHSKAIQRTSVLVTLGAIVFLGLTLTGGLSPHLNPKPHQASGWYLAHQALARLKPGGQMVLITRDTTAFENPATDFQLTSFLKTLRKAHVAVTSIRAPPSRSLAAPSKPHLENSKNSSRRCPPAV